MYCAPVMAPVAAPLLGVSPAAVGYFVTTAYLGSMIGTATAGGWVERFGPIRVSQGNALCGCGLAIAASGTLPGVLVGPSSSASATVRPRRRARDPRAYRAPRHAFADLLDQADRRAARHRHRGRDGAFWCSPGLAMGRARRRRGLRAFRPGDHSLPRRIRQRAQSLRASVLRSALAPVLLVLREPSIMPLAATSFVYGGVQITLVAYLVAFLTESFALSLVLAGIVMAASQLASVAGRVLWGIAADRALSRRATLGMLGVGMGITALSRSRSAGPHWPLWALFAFAVALGVRRQAGTACFSPS